MKKLTTLASAAVLAAAAGQASAAISDNQLQYNGVWGAGAANACLFVLSCTVGGTGAGIHVNYSNAAAADGVLDLAEAHAGEANFQLIVNNAVFATADFAAVQAATDIFNVDLSTGAFDMWWSGAISPHVIYSGGADTTIALEQGCDSANNVGTCGALSGDPFIDLVTNPVPVPAAAWLFGSALLGLAGVGRKRRA
jgi:hypothetical protein